MKDAKTRISAKDAMEHEWFKTQRDEEEAQITDEDQ